MKQSSLIHSRIVLSHTQKKKNKGKETQALKILMMNKLNWADCGCQVL